MSASLRNKYERLLRWYPRIWRDEHGRLMLDTLDEHASDRGIGRPGIAEAWSIRAHGLGERATNRWAVVAAAVSLAAFAIATGILLSDALQLPGAGAAQIVLAMFVGPLALSLAVLILLHRRGQLSAPASLCMAAGALPSWAVAALAAASLSIAFDEADAGMGRTWFGSATLLFMLLAWFFGTATLLAPVASLVDRKLPVPIRWLLIVLVAAVASLALGVAAAVGQMMGAVVAATALVLAVVASQPVRPEVRGADMQRTGLPPRTGPRAAPARSTYAKVCAAALVSFVVGFACAVLALTGSTWAPGVGDSTNAMNLGLAAGALAAMPAVVAAALLLTPRFGAIVGWSALLLCAGLGVASAAQFSGAGSSLQWPLMLLAAVLGSLAFALPVSGLLSTRPAVRIAVGVALGLAGVVPAIMAVTAAGFIAPVAAAALAVWAWRRLNEGRRRPVSQVSYPH
ncbi:MAG: hypothetical protein ACTH8J_16650 [Specibacter sp.]